MSDYRIYVACLASYNNGVLHGRWIDLGGTDEETVQEEIAAMLRESPCPNVEVDCPECGGRKLSLLPCPLCRGKGKVPSAEEWAIHDYEGFPSSFGEYASIGELLRYANLHEKYGAAFEVWYRNADADIKTDEDAFNEAYEGEFDELSDWAERFIEETGLLSNVPDELARYFDTEAYARDYELGGDIWSARDSHGRLHVFRSR